MYEFAQSGLGWSDLPSYPTCEAISGGGIKRCFTSTASDQACARSCGCLQTQEVCETSSGNGGTKWCCPRNCPTTSTGCTPPTRNLICELNRVDINSLTDSRARATWLLKNRLCAQRIDPGAVNGTVDTRLSEALRAFQSRQGLPVTGQADQATLYQLGFNAQEATDYANAIAQPSQLVSSVQLPWALIAASTAASMFLMYAVWKYTRRGK